MMESPLEVLESLRADLFWMIDETPRLTDKLMQLADQVDEVFKGVKIGKLTGASTAIVGGVLAAIGFGLSFATFGASFGLTIAGATIAGLGGAAVAVAQIVDAIRSTKKFKAAEEAIKEYNNIKETLTEKIVKIGIELETLGDIDRDFTEWVEFVARLVYQGCKTGKSIGWNIIGSTIRASRAIAEGIALGGSKAGVTAFKTVGTTGLRAAGHIGAGVVGILLIPLDVYTLVDSAIDTHKKTPHKVSKQIRETAKMLEDGCPTKQQVDEAIEKTLENMIVFNGGLVAY